MLSLQLPTASAAADAPDPLLLDEGTARCLERALLTTDLEVRQQELTVAVVADRPLANWLMRWVELRTSQTVNRIDQAVAWLAPRIATEMSVALREDTIEAIPDSAEWRLPRLIAILASDERRHAEFDRRLEREKLESLKELAYGAS